MIIFILFIDIVRELMLRYNKFSLSSAIQFGIQGLDALEILHREGFVHRDVKLV
jgi:serine/threonine protein kinase